jgi:hypothetical protein
VPELEFLIEARVGGLRGCIAAPPHLLLPLLHHLKVDPKIILLSHHFVFAQAAYVSSIAH